MADLDKQPDEPDEDSGDIAIDVGRFGRFRVGRSWREYVGPWLKWPILAVSVGMLLVMFCYAVSLLWTAR